MAQLKQPASATLAEAFADQYESFPPKVWPRWMNADDLAYMAEQFRKSGFFGPISWYRNSLCAGATDLLELNAEHSSKKFEMPAMFLYGGNPGGGPPRAERKKAKETAKLASDDAQPGCFLLLSFRSSRERC